MLNELFHKLADEAAGGTLILDRRSLPSRPALLLFDRLLGTETLVLFEPEVTRQGDAIHVSGKANVLGIDHCAAVASIDLADDELSVRLDLLPFEGWRLGQSFPSLRGTSFETMPLGNPRLRVTTHGDDGAATDLRDGLTLTADVPIGEVIPALGPILGRITNLPTSGRICVARSTIVAAIDNAETLRISHLDDPQAELEVELDATLPIELDLPGFELSDLAVRIEGPNVVEFLAFRDIRHGIHGRIAIANEAFDVEIAITKSGFVSLRVLPENLRIPSLRTLAAMAPGIDLEAVLPDDLPGFERMQVYRIDADVDLAARQISLFGVGLAVAEPWIAAGGALSVSDAHLYVVVTDATSPQRRVGCTLSGIVALGGVTVEVTGHAPEFLFSAFVPDLPLSRIAADLAPGLAGLVDLLPEMDFRDVEVTLDPKRGAFALRAESDATWTIPIGVGGLEIVDLVLEWHREPGEGPEAGSSGLVTGRMLAGGAEVEIEYRLPGNFVLRGQIPSLSFSPLLQAIAGTGVLRDLPLPPALVDLKIEDVYVSIAPEQKTASLAGRVAAGEAEIVFSKTSTGGWGCAVGIRPSTDWRFSDLSSELAGLDALSPSDLTLVIATAEDGSLMLSTITPARPDVRLNRDEFGSIPPAPLDVAVKRGLNVFSKVSLAGTGADGLLGVGDLDVYAAVGSRAAELVLEATLDGQIRIAENVRMGRLGFRLRPAPGSFAVTLMGTVFARIGDDELEFVGGLEIQPTAAAMQATMLGRWTDAFGARGFDLENVALDLGILFSAPPVPRVGIAATMALGAVRGTAAIRFDSANPGRSMLAVAFDRLFLIDVVNGMCPGAANALRAEARQLVAGIGMTDVDVYVAPLPTRIGAIRFEQGLHLRGRLQLPGFEAACAFEVDPAKGLKGAGAMPAVDIGGMFRVTGSRGDDDPELEIDMRVGEPFAIKVDGKVELLGMAATAAIHLRDRGFHFELEGKIFDAFEARVAARGSHIDSSTGFMLDVSMKNDLSVFLSEQAGAAIRDGADGAMRELDETRNRVRARQREVDRLDGVIAATRARVKRRNESRLRDAEAEVAGWRTELQELDGVIRTERARAKALWDAQQRELAKATAKVEAAEREVDKLGSKIATQKARIKKHKKKIKSKKAWVDRGAWYEKAKRGIVFAAYAAGKEAEIAVAYAKIGGYETAKKTAWLALQAAKAILKGVRAAAMAVPPDANPTVLGPIAARESAQLALRAASGTLAGLRQAATSAMIDLDPEVSGPLALRGTAWLALESAQGVLAATRTGLGGLADAGQWVVENGLTGLVEVRSARFACSLESGHAGAVDLELSVAFLRQRARTLTLGFDFHDPLAAAKELARRLTA
ncbi:MAG: hypothetical protein KDE27_21695 [Planctomycetes bacterium]|nr:hypothetical protein [Planctomycetota bacterium]